MLRLLLGFRGYIQNDGVEADLAASSAPQWQKRVARFLYHISDCIDMWLMDHNLYF